MGVDLNSVTGANYPGGAWSAFKHHFLDNSQTAQDVAGAWEKALEYWSDPSRINRDAQSAFEALPSLQELGQGARNLGSAAVDEAAAIYADPGLAASGAWTWAKDEAAGAWERAKDIYGKDGVPGVAGAAVGVIGDAVSPSKKLRALKEGADAVHDLEKTKKLLQGGGKAIEEGNALIQDGNKAEKGLNEASKLERTVQNTAQAAENADLSLTYKPGWSAAQRAEADVKVQILSEGETVVTQSTRSGTSAASRYRSAGNQIPAGSDVDHAIDLQLGGSDTVSNLWPLNSSVNRSLGAQIQQQIKNLPAGTVINKVTIGDR